MDNADEMYNTPTPQEGTPAPQQATDPAAAEQKRIEDSEQIRKWLSRIKSSEQYRERIARLYRWNEIIDEYKGRFLITQGASDIYIPPLNLIFAYVRTEIPGLYLRDPKIKVNPKNEASIGASKILEKAINYIWRHKRLKRENKKNVLDTLLVGHSWFKTGYTGNFGSIEDGNGNTFEFIESEDFFGYRIPWDQITFNPDALDPPYDCKWIAHEVWMPLEEVKNNKLFQRTEELKPSSRKLRSGERGNEPDSPKEDSEIAMVKLYEVWDKKSQTVFTVSEGCGYYHREPAPWPYDMRGFPFSYLRFNDNPDCPYGVPDVYTFEPQVMELIKIRAMMFDHYKRYNRQLISRKGALSDESKSQFAQGITGAVIEADIASNEALDNVVKPIPYPAIQSDIWAIEERLKEDIINISGQSPQERGGTQKTTTRTKAELIQMAKGSQNRRSDKQGLVESFVEDGAYNLVALLQQFADVPYYVRVTGQEAQEIAQALASRPSAQKPGAVTSAQGFTFTKEDIQGEFDIEVVAGSTAPLDEEAQITQLTEALGLAPQLGLMPGGPVITTIGKELAEKFDMPSIIQAVDQEVALAAKRSQEQSQQQDAANQQAIAAQAADVQLKAEQQATKQNELLLKMLELLMEQKQAEKDKKDLSEVGQ